MKKQLDQFDLFERTKTPNGMMMRVPGGWELNGAYIPSDKFGHKEVEVYDKIEEGEARKSELSSILKNLIDQRYEITGSVTRSDVVNVHVIKKIFLEYKIEYKNPF